MTIFKSYISLSEGIDSHLVSFVWVRTWDAKSVVSSYCSIYVSDRCKTGMNMFMWWASMTYLLAKNQTNWYCKLRPFAYWLLAIDAWDDSPANLEQAAFGLTKPVSFNQALDQHRTSKSEKMVLEYQTPWDRIYYRMFSVSSGATFKQLHLVLLSWHQIRNGIRIPSLSTILLQSNISTENPLCVDDITTDPTSAKISQACLVQPDDETHPTQPDNACCE